jgi:hypothetical protein
MHEKLAKEISLQRKQGKKYNVKQGDFFAILYLEATQDPHLKGKEYKIIE